MPQSVSLAIDRPSLTIDRISQASLRWPIFLICLWLDVLAVTLVVLLSLLQGERPDAQFAEGGLMTYFSAGQLGVLAGLSLELFVVRRFRRIGAAHARRSWIWLIIAAGMIGLACDEAFELHERLDLALHQWLGLRESPWTDRIDDLIVLGYGLTGLALLWLYRGELMRFRRIWPYLAIAFTLFFTMVGLDLLTNSYSIAPERIGSPAMLANATAWANVLEDSCKIVSEAAFLGAFIAMLCLASQAQQRR